MASTNPTYSVGSGLLVITRNTPDWALAPYSEPWGPLRASTRSISTMRGSGVAFRVRDCSSRYSAADGSAMKVAASSAIPRNTILAEPGLEPTMDRLGMNRT